MFKKSLARNASFIAPRNPLLQMPRDKRPDYVEPSVDTNPTFKFAMEQLQKEQDILSKLAETTVDPVAKNKKQVEFEYTKLENHFKFLYHKVDDTSGVFEQFYFDRFKSFVLPRLEYFAKKHDIVGDLIPEFFEQKAVVDVQFKGYTKWLGAYGHAVPAKWTLNSPQLKIKLPNNEQGLYSVILLDIDRPLKGELQHWCHWFVANIPIEKDLTINAQPNTVFKKEFVGDYKKVEKSSTVGSTILEYCPVHPAHSNPKKSRRYVLLLLKQDNELPKDFNLERSDVFPFVKFAKNNGLQPFSLNFFSSSWDLDVSQIYSCLGEHEPVYGRLPNQGQTRFVQKLAKSTELLNEQGIELPALKSKLQEARKISYPINLARQVASRTRVRNNLYDLLNLGKSFQPRNDHMTKFYSPALKAQLEKREQRKEKVLAREAKKKGITVDQLKSKLEIWRNAWRSNAFRKPGISSIAAVAISKNK